MIVMSVRLSVPLHEHILGEDRHNRASAIRKVSDPMAFSTYSPQTNITILPKLVTPCHFLSLLASACPSNTANKKSTNGDEGNG
jgi:hypothetical protein